MERLGANGGLGGGEEMEEAGIGLCVSFSEVLFSLYYA